MRISSNTSRSSFNAHEGDPIFPSSIEHKVEEVWSAEGSEQPDQVYNFIDYHFEQDGAYLRARVYLDHIGNVTLFGPFVRRGYLDKTVAPQAEKAVMVYLSRRFRHIDRL